MCSPVEKCSVCIHRDENKTVGQCSVCTDNKLHVSRFKPDPIVGLLKESWGVEEDENFVTHLPIPGVVDSE